MKDLSAVKTMILSFGITSSYAFTVNVGFRKTLHKIYFADGL